MHIVHVICMLSAHVHIICLSSLTLLFYHAALLMSMDLYLLPQLSFFWIVSSRTLSMSIWHVVCTCTRHLLLISNTVIYPIIHNLVSVHIVSTNLSISSVYWDAYVMYMFSFLLLLFAYVHVIRILSEHMCIMRTLSAVVLDIFLLIDNADVIHMSSLVLFIYPIMYNLVSGQCTNAHCPCHLHVVMYTSFACHL